MFDGSTNSTLWSMTTYFEVRHRAMCVEGACVDEGRTHSMGVRVGGIVLWIRRWLWDLCLPPWSTMRIRCVRKASVVRCVRWGRLCPCTPVLLSPPRHPPPPTPHHHPLYKSTTKHQCEFVRTDPSGGGANEQRSVGSDATDYARHTQALYNALVFNFSRWGTGWYFEPFKHDPGRFIFRQPLTKQWLGEMRYALCSSAAGVPAPARLTQLRPGRRVGARAPSCSCSPTHCPSTRICC